MTVVIYALPKVRQLRVDTFNDHVLTHPHYGFIKDKDSHRRHSFIKSSSIIYWLPNIFVIVYHLIVSEV